MMVERLGRQAARECNVRHEDGDGVERSIHERAHARFCVALFETVGSIIEAGGLVAVSIYKEVDEVVGFRSRAGRVIAELGESHASLRVVGQAEWRSAWGD